MQTQFHDFTNQFSLNFQPISLHIVNNFMIWHPYPHLYKIDSMDHITLLYKEPYITYKIVLITPHNRLYYIFIYLSLLSSLGPCMQWLFVRHHQCDLDLFDDFGDHFVVYDFWCVQILILQPSRKRPIWWQMEVGCLQPPSKSLLYFTRYVKWGIVQKDEPFVYEG